MFEIDDGNRFRESSIMSIFFIEHAPPHHNDNVREGYQALNLTYDLTATTPLE